MSPDHNATNKLLDVLDRLEADPQSNELRLTLREMLLADEELRRQLILRAHMTGGLRWMLGSSAPYADNEMPLLITAVAADRKRSLRFPKWLHSPAASVTFVAVVFYSTFALIAWNLRPENQPTSIAVSQDKSTPSTAEDSIASNRVIAKLTGTQDVRWAGTSAEQPQVGDEIRANRLLELVSGIAGLTLTDGTEVVIEGPTRLTVESARYVHLARGKLVAQVPKQVIGFTVGTPTVEIVDLGTEFGVEVAPIGSTDVFVHQGKVEVNPKAAPNGITEQSIKLTAGRAVRVTMGEQKVTNILYDESRFDHKAAKAQAPKPISRESEFTGPLWLGNLFDDPRGTSLGQAMETDTFRAAAEIDDLGLDRALYFGEPLKQIANGIWFDFTNLGWNGQQPRILNAVANDSWADESNEDEHYSKFLIRTLGKTVDSVIKSKVEEGVGMNSNALVTFDIHELRIAGALQGQMLDFVCDRAGINDDNYKEKHASTHMVALVCSEREVLSAVIDGASASLTKHDGHWSISGEIGSPLRADGRFVGFRVAIPPEARYLTLAATAAGDGPHCDHAVWSGARIEIVNPSSERDKP